MTEEYPSDDEIKQLEEELAGLESQEKNYGSPTQQKKDSALILFRDLIKEKDSRKFGNLTTEELGKTNLSVRGTLNIAHFFDTQGLTPIGDYFRQKAEITNATSMSRKGWFGNLIVTQIKKDLKETREPSPEVRRSIFGKSKSKEVIPE